MKLITLTLACVLAVGGCHLTPAQQAEETQIENTILADLAAGKTLQQIEADVGKIVAGQPGVDVVVIVNDALQLLIDLGVIPTNELPQAKSMIAVLHTSILSRGVDSGITAPTTHAPAVAVVTDAGASADAAAAPKH
jgi:hypothetical protein